MLTSSIGDAVLFSISDFWDVVVVDVVAVIAVVAVVQKAAAMTSWDQVSITKLIKAKLSKKSFFILIWLKFHIFVWIAQ